MAGEEVEAVEGQPRLAGSAEVEATVGNRVRRAHAAGAVEAAAADGAVAASVAEGSGVVDEDSSYLVR